jgi:hypothetical protein
MIVKSFGCSFIFGTDLADDGRDTRYATRSANTWPALIACDLQLDYACYARPGAGNLRILDRILIQAAGNEPDIFVIGWTWIDRFDYRGNNTWWSTVMPVDSTDLAHCYYRDIHDQFRDKLTNLIYIRTAIDTLKQKNIPFFMTYMDELLFERDHHCNPAISDLQDYVRPYLHNYNGSNFLDWSRQQGFKISDTAHPLEEAHRAAADQWLPQIQSLV